MKNLNLVQAKELLAIEKEKFNNYKKMNLKLDMSRGKPSKEQLDLSKGMFDIFCSDSKDFGSPDYRNYGIVDGITEAKTFFGELYSASNDEIMVLGNSSLNIMYDTVQRAMQFGVLNGIPFNKQSKLKWLCPVPGYDRHFAVTELFGIEMITIPMNSDGPDMDMIESMVKNDEEIKGIWCVPKYSNPQGIVYNDEVVKRFAKLKPKAKDFRIYWDNAYMMHLFAKDIELLNIFQEAKKYNNENILYIFGSTSKITYAGGGVSFIVASKENLDSLRNYMKIQTIGPDKINQYTHVKYFKNLQGMKEHMKKHANIMKPKFDMVDKIHSDELKDFAEWNKHDGGYFISCDLK